MTENSAFKIYDASAGSGKTFTLVKAYLSLLFKAKSNNAFRNILAITFTNKAVGEMKTRIVAYLKDFSEERILESKDAMFFAIAEELQLEPKHLHNKSKQILNTILHNYASLNVSTIDGFNHSLIRTFAHDLNLPINFEVELDTTTLLQKAVDELIAKAGTDKRLTETLINFALEKADDDKSWDISRDLYAIAELLTKENHIESLNKLSKANFEDFKTFKTSVLKQRNDFKAEIESKTSSILNAFESNGLTKADFSRGTLFTHFVKANQFQFTGLYSNQLEKNIAENKIYTAKLDADKKSIIDGLLSQISDAYHGVKKAYYSYKYYGAIYKNITPLSLLNQINQTLKTIKTEDNKMLISEFNTIISDEIKHQPTPFIYERIGERFQHYFIDEFQDTSELQWNNLQPLIDNTLSGQTLGGDKGSAMIVGDAKQAIYRWRGGKAEQFLGLINEDDPFVVSKNVVRLENNFRSHKAIVDFNNGFFEFVATNAMSDTIYENLYKNAPQKLISENAGCVSVSFLDYPNKDEGKALYAHEVLERIKECQDLNYQLKDICVLVRKKDEAKTIANHLGENGVKFTSSDSLLLVNAKEVVFINAVLQFFVAPEDAQNRLTILKFLADKFEAKDKHEFYNNHIHLSSEEFFDSLKVYSVTFNPSELKQLPLYELAETIVRCFTLVDYSNAYIQFYLETILEFTQKQIGSILEFLDFFQTNSKKLKISTSEDANAVKIMTIHSSKGLEFPVVIYPFVDLNIYKEINPQEWVGISNADTPNVKTALIDYSKEFEFFTEEANAIHIDHKAKQELDALNVFYVALTRPVERLYVLAKKDKKPSLETYQGLLSLYLEKLGENLETQETVVFGALNQQKVKENKEEAKPDKAYSKFISIAKEDHDINMVTKFGDLWDTKQEEAIQRGNYIHDIMEKVIVKADLDKAILYQINKGNISKETTAVLKPQLVKMMNSPKLEAYFSSEYQVYNEKDILLQNGDILRPDRFVVKNNLATIIDYKTGLKDSIYKEQLYSYQLALEQSGFKVDKLLIVYINDEITIEEV